MVDASNQQRIGRVYDHAAYSGFMSRGGHLLPRFTNTIVAGHTNGREICPFDPASANERKGLGCLVSNAHRTRPRRSHQGRAILSMLSADEVLSVYGDVECICLLPWIANSVFLR